MTDASPQVERLQILRLGAAGEGVANSSDGALRHIVGALPGEVVEAAPQNQKGPWRLIRILEPSADRIRPTCPHATLCGGCSLQHMESRAQADWKRARIVGALAARGLEADVALAWTAPEKSRRRVRLAGRRGKSGPKVGFHARASHQVAPIEDCAIASPPINAALPALRQLTRLAAPRDRAVSLSLTETATGLDLTVDNAKPIDLALSEAVAEWMARDAPAADIIRLTWNGDLFAMQAEPTLKAGSAAFAPPPGGFLQASVAAENEMARLAIDGLAGARRVADLFCGAGAFALRLASAEGLGAETLALDADADAIAALGRAARVASGLKRVIAKRRDLFRDPLSPRELAGLDGAVIDPPRAGAEAQCVALADAPFDRLISISCNPATFARDAAILIRGGWRLTQVQPIDQFRHSAHVELVAVLTR